MQLRILMAAVRKGSSGALERVTSAGTGSRNKPKGVPVRGFHPNSSPVYKTQSETSLTAGLRNLTIKDTNVTKRTFSGKTNGNTTVKNLTDASNLLQTGAVQKVVIVAGAGISTPSGIPDFRSGKADVDELSPGTGLYDNLQQYQIPYPEAIFDIDYFHTYPRPFFTLAKELYPSGKYRPNYIHYFARLLHDKGMLLRMYTQNIDGLERLAGLPAEKLVEAHGTFATATCTICKMKLEGEQIKEKIFADKLPRCLSRGCVGIMKPDIVFFGEDLPRKFYSYMKDMLQTDMVLVMGTSLEVQPFAGIIDTVRSNVPRILFNRESVGPFRYSRRSQDVVAAGDLVDNMIKFSGMIGWKDDMVQLITTEEGEFKIEKWKQKPKNPPPKLKSGTQINKSPPKPPPGNQTRNYSTLARRYPGTRFSDSSSEEESESETSSDSSEEETKNSRFKGIRRGKITNGYQRNGANRQNGFRSSSAKMDTSNKRRLHVEAAERNNNVGNNIAGSITGRSVKSESGINNNLAKRRLENKNSDPKSTVPGSFVKNQVSKQNVTKAERERVLRKYGLSPHPKYNKTSEQVRKVKPSSKGKVAVPETIFFAPKRNLNTFDTNNKNDKCVPFENSLVREKPLDGTILMATQVTALQDEKESSKEESLPTSNNNSDTVEHLEQNSTPDNQTSEPANFQRERTIVSGYFIDDLKTNMDNVTNGEEQHKNLKNSNTNQDKESQRDRKGKSDWHISDTESNLSTDSKILKKLSNKTMQSFEKYASMSMQRRVIGHEAQTKPPSGYKHKQQEKDLGLLNPRPYGFANRFKNSPSGVIPVKRPQAPTLNRSVQYSEIVNIKSPLPAPPKIAYQHKKPPTANTYDARVFGPRPDMDSSSDGCETSDNDSR